MCLRFKIFSYDLDSYVLESKGKVADFPQPRSPLCGEASPQCEIHLDLNGSYKRMSRDFSDDFQRQEYLSIDSPEFEKDIERVTEIANEVAAATAVIDIEKLASIDIKVRYLETSE